MAISTQDFLKAAEPTIQRLREIFGPEGPHVSDVLDAQGHQYVNLVQEGGGVLGVALVGYTYVLEQMGIRFMKMAGTSAGAINTMVLTCMGNKEEAKSARVLAILNETQLFEFLDGDSAVKNIIRRMLTSESFFQKLIRRALLLFIMLIISSLGLAFALGKSNVWLLGIFGFLFLLSSGTALAALFWAKNKGKKFYRSEYGINPGRKFLDWISSILAQRNIHNLEDLRQHVEKVPTGGFHLREGAEPTNLKDLNNPKMEDFLVLVTSDITNQMKVEFPRMWRLYWRDAAEVNPAYFVRASMAVPIFFEPFKTPDIDPNTAFSAWEELAGVDDPTLIPQRARFIDGGMISNFPINVFYNTQVNMPRLPTFGIMLEDDEDAATPSEKTSFMGYLGAMFNTVRYNYDREFLRKHNDFAKTVGKVDVRGFNWLNFNLTDDEKLRLFLQGVEGAARFLAGPNYKTASPTQTTSSDTTTPTQRGAAVARRATRPLRTNGFNWEGYKAYRVAQKAQQAAPRNPSGTALE